ncbi:type III secretion system chaperone family protein [Sediminispirochaeta bajacaliforniensis]|uniref:hypothetical protein n=1 Tax=Sediminispirochaeta bajacaliforniensis TaxID=148 RepID=UPI00037AACBC|nr:hypothetical protein [Sediminispirochaeta bajacaliforniensis]
MNAVERYLLNLDLNYEEVAAKTYIIHEPEKGLENVAVMLDDPLVIVQVKVMDVPSSGRERFFRTLLNLNATDLIHGAYGVNGDEVILIDTLRSATMDLEEFQACLDAIGLALSQHYRILSDFR